MINFKLQNKNCERLYKINDGIDIVMNGQSLEINTRESYYAVNSSQNENILY